MAEAFEECIADAGIEKSQIEAAWQSTGVDAFSVGPGAMPLSMGLRLPDIPVTKIENYCASGTEAFRAATYAVASGACDIALAVGFASDNHEIRMLTVGDKSLLTINDILVAIANRGGTNRL